MIARIWRGRTKESVADEYAQYIRATGFPLYESTPGNRGIYLLRRTIDGITEFHVLSFWGSVEDVCAFTGPDLLKAVYFPRDKEFLLEFEPNVTHFEVLEEELVPAPSAVSGTGSDA